MFRIEHNVKTGEIKQIELTPEESTELEQQYAQTQAAQAAQQAAEAAKAAQKQAVLDRLGLTTEEVKLLLGGN